MFNLSLNDVISAETLITWLYSAVINHKYYTLMLHGKRCKKCLKNVVSFILPFMILLKNMDFWVPPWGVLDGTA